MASINRNIFLLLIVLSFGCKKNHVEETIIDQNPTMYNKLIGKWRVFYEYSHKDTNGITVIIDTNYRGLASDYVEFKNNDTAYFKVGSQFSKGYFKLINNDSIYMFNENRKIELLNENTLIYSFGYKKVGIYDFTYYDYLEKW